MKLIILKKKENYLLYLKYNYLFIIQEFIKLLLIINIFISLIKYNIRRSNYNLELNEHYLAFKNKYNYNSNNNLTNKIRVGIYSYTMKNGGRARISALLLNYLFKIKIFQIYLFTVRMTQDNEYIFPINIKRIITENNLIKYIKAYKIDILIYQLDYINEIKILNEIKNIKTLFYIHSSTFDWIYNNYTVFKTIYNEYIKSKYIVSLVPLKMIMYLKNGV